MKKYDIAIIGGGPGGYVAAIRAGQLGFKTVIIDKDNLGGVCLNWGCIPTKSLLKNAEVFDTIKNHSAEFGINVSGVSVDFPKVIKRSREISDRITKNVELLMKKNKIDRIRGFGKLKSRTEIEIFENDIHVENISATSIIISTGARPRMVPQIPVDNRRIITSTEAMILTEPPKELVVIGAGAIGVEFSYFYNIFGSKVTLIEMMENILPIEDKEVSITLEKIFKKRGIEVLTKTIVEKAEVTGDKVRLLVTTEGRKKEITADVVLNSIGVVGNVENLGLEKAGIIVEKNHIKVDKKNYKTNVDNIYAIGDVIGAPWLAHVASAEGIACIEGIKGLEPHPVDYSSIPGCTYCQPQVASIGLTEEKARAAGYELKIGKFPFMASGKAFAVGDREGFVKLIFDAKYGELLGAHIIGAEATELIAELGIVKALEGTGHSILKTIHAHPTLSEAIMEAAANAYGEAIHI